MYEILLFSIRFSRVMRMRKTLFIANVSNPAVGLFCVPQYVRTTFALAIGDSVAYPLCPPDISPARSNRYAIYTGAQPSDKGRICVTRHLGAT